MPMIICKVIGHVWATKKDSALEGFKLMVVRQEDAPNDIMVAVDVVGAGIGEQVLVVGGSTARRAAGKDDLPIDAAIVGIIDTIEVEKALLASEPGVPELDDVAVELENPVVAMAVEPIVDEVIDYFEPPTALHPRRTKPKKDIEGSK